MVVELQPIEIFVQLHVDKVITMLIMMNNLEVNKVKNRHQNLDNLVSQMDIQQNQKIYHNLDLCLVIVNLD